MRQPSPWSVRAFVILVVSLVAFVSQQVSGAETGEALVGSVGVYLTVGVYMGLRYPVRPRS